MMNKAIAPIMARADVACITSKFSLTNLSIGVKISNNGFQGRVIPTTPKINSLSQSLSFHYQPLFNQIPFSDFQNEKRQDRQQ
jgi:hypothetical protein